MSKILLQLSFYGLLISHSSIQVSAFLGTPSGRGKIGVANQKPTYSQAIQNMNAEIGTALFSLSDGDEEKVTASATVQSQQYVEILQDAINLNSIEASLVILSKITEMRQSGDYTVQEVDEFLNNLLAAGPDARLPIWTAVRPLTRFSRRARMRSLRRTLDQITPDADQKSDSVESQLQRRRRALVSLLRSMSAEETGSDSDSDSESGEAAGTKKGKRPAIVSIERRAILASKESVSDLTSRRPEGLETPKYDVIASGKDSVNRMAKNMEIRAYKPYSVCSVSMVKPTPSETSEKLGSPELGGASSFGALAGYLFGKNDQSTAMKMTTPVITTNPGEMDSESNQLNDPRMQFVLPSNYWGTENLTKAPLPLESSGVTLQERQSEVRAVLMFGGYASKKENEKRKKELLSSLSKRDSKWKPAEDTVSLSQYNDPFTVPWRRLNEVSVKVENR